jgi:regulator of cell morphogenesis and NO signaling
MDISAHSPNCSGPAADAPLDAVVTHLLDAHHAPTRALLTDLARLAAEATALDDGPLVRALDARLRTLRDDLEAHMRKEEIILFPYVIVLERTHARGGRRPPAAFSSVVYPVRVMELEHEDAGRMLEALRRLTDGYRPPAMASEPLLALFRGLEALDDDLVKHVALESKGLFPRAIDLERAFV